MAVLTWQNIADTEIDEESIVSEALVGKFHNNHEALGSQGVDTRHVEGSHTGTTVQTTVSSGVPFFLPAAHATTDGDIQLVISLDIKIDNGAGGAPAGTMTVTVDIGGATQSVSSFATSTYTRQEFRFSTAQTRAMTAGISSFDVKIQLTNSGDQGYAKCENGASRLERVA